MEAVLLVGGQGTRLRPLTDSTPKPVLPVAGVPFLVHQLLRLKAVGATRVILATSYRPQAFADAVGDGARIGMDVVHVHETEPLGTGGAIANAGQQLTSAPEDPVLVVNGDILGGADLAALLDTHKRSEAEVTLHLVEVADPRAFGLVPTDAEGRVTAFLEKPQTPEEIVTRQVNAGCYVFRRAQVDRIPTGRKVSVERETFPGLIAAGAMVQGHVDSSYWLDLGTPAAYVQACTDLVTGVVSSPAYTAPPAGAAVDPTAVVEPGAVLAGGSVVGPGAHVGAGATITGSVLLAGAAVGGGSTVTASALGAGATVGERCVLDHVVIGDGAQVADDNELRAGLRLWTGAHLGPAMIRFTGGAGS